MNGLYYKVIRVTFLQHILTLDEVDPVKLVYKEQLKYKYENNWANEVNKLRERYNLELPDSEIEKIDKLSWKKSVKTAIYKEALTGLNDECSSQKKTSYLTPYSRIGTQKYFVTANQARIYFQLRTNTLDIKAMREYKYEDKICQLCEEGEEDIEHVLNECRSLSQRDTVQNIHQATPKDVNSITTLLKVFLDKVEELEKEAQENKLE